MVSIKEMGSILRAIRYVLNIQIQIGSQAKNIYYTSDFELVGSQHYLDEIEALTIYNNPNERSLLKLNEHIEILTDIISMGNQVLLLSNLEDDIYNINVHLIHRYRYPFSTFYISKRKGSDYQYTFYKKSNENLNCDELSEIVSDKATLLSGNIKEINNTRMIDICKEFYSFLKNSAYPISPSDQDCSQDNRNNTKELFPMSLVGKIHELCNNIQFAPISQIEMFNAFNNPKEFGYKIKYIEGQKVRVCFLIRCLSEIVYKQYSIERKKEWLNDILLQLNIKESLYNKKSNSIKGYNNTSPTDDVFYIKLKEIFDLKD